MDILGPVASYFGFDGEVFRNLAHLLRTHITLPDKLYFVASLPLAISVLWLSEGSPRASRFFWTIGTILLWPVFAPISYLKKGHWKTCVILLAVGVGWPFFSYPRLVSKVSLAMYSTLASEAAAMQDPEAGKARYQLAEKFAARAIRFRPSEYTGYIQYIIGAGLVEDVQSVNRAIDLFEESGLDWDTPRKKVKKLMVCNLAHLTALNIYAEKAKKARSEGNIEAFTENLRSTINEFHKARQGLSEHKSLLVKDPLLMEVEPYPLPKTHANLGIGSTDGLKVAHKNLRPFIEVVQKFLRVLDSNSKWNSAVHDWFAAQLMLNHREYTEARRLFSNAVKAAPKFAEGHLGIGNALLASGRPRDAQPWLKRGIRIINDQGTAICVPSANTTLSGAYVSLAKAFMKRAVKEPLNYSAHENSAYRLLEQAEQLKPEDKSLREEIKALKKKVAPILIEK